MSKEELSSTKSPSPFPWRMEPYLSNLMELLESNPKLAIKISLLTLEYDKKCSIARIELYDQIQHLMEGVV